MCHNKTQHAVQTKPKLYINTLPPLVAQMIKHLPTMWETWV